MIVGITFYERFFGSYWHFMDWPAEFAPCETRARMALKTASGAPPNGRCVKRAAVKMPMHCYLEGVMLVTWET